MSNLEDDFLQMINYVGIPTPEREFAFSPPRRWKADLAWPDAMILAEVQGGNWNGGRHVRPSALNAEYEKLNTAQLLGYRIFLFTPEMIRSGEALNTIELALKIRST